ncbi:MAG: NAD(+) diphosphatase [Treponema sp.]|jgi:NAD+ diphosphatase|nr:NAD(+) diphosphatase [Treponema sp.]
MTDCAFFFQGGAILLPEGASAALNPELPLARAKDFPLADVFALPGIIPDGAASCVDVPPEAALPPHWQAIPLRQVISALPDCLTGETGMAAKLIRVFHIAQWRRESKFCGTCGAKNTSHAEEFARLCPSCGRVEYPRIAPAVITLITNNEGKALLAHNRKFAPGVYSLIAGFAEAGENLEAAVARETHEEAGIEICDIRYLLSQPWPFPYSLMTGFSARYASGTIRPDGVEIEDVQWFSRDSLPSLPGTGSISRRLIEQWKNSG